MCQGNEASPAVWTVTSIPMIAMRKRKGHRMDLVAKMLETTGHVVGWLFVDDTDLIHLDMQTIKTTLEAHAKLQE
jgi:hypothetical protein